MLSESQLHGLQILATQVMHLLEIRKANQNLNDNKIRMDQSLLDQTQEIAEQNIVLEKMNNELQAFTYISSHDLQEPLRKIQTFTSWLSEKEAERLSEKGQEYLNKIERASGRMSQLIRDLLNYSRATTTISVFESTTLKVLFDDVTSDLADEISSKQAVMELAKDVQLNVIPFQFRQLLYNLMSNSLKFSRIDVVPKITVSYQFGFSSDFNNEKLESSLNYHVISVSDNGIGFDSKYSDKIFELFQRLGTRQVQIGTGVGLAIVKKIVENHNGHIKAWGEHNHGARFDIYIPEK
ncbi:sensor histidine kinase [Flavobacterium silvaticum]|uniref:sensor histidine kinase n=1 Tax=Flavobacterium silvaticum TaxID=1852020 RepID=UPI001F350E55|nr:ATP-binding protein [Flavobacterium silvaticum]